MSVILVTDRITDLAIESNLIPGYRLCTPADNFSNSDVVALLVWHEHITCSYMQKYPNLRFIVRYGVGFDNIDLASADQQGLICVNTPDYGVDEVAQTALSFILGISRGTFWYSLNPGKDLLWTNPSRLPLSRSSSTTVGIIGAGRIGSKLALYLRSLNFSVCIYDPFISSGYEKILDCTRSESILDLLSTSDYVSINCPLNAQTSGLIDATFLSAMKPGSSLVNTARGGIFSDDIVPLIIDHLASGHLWSFATDVLPIEPPLDTPHIPDELKGRYIVNPHVAYYSHQALQECRTKAATKLYRLLSGEPVRDIISATALDHS